MNKGRKLTPAEAHMFQTISARADYNWTGEKEERMSRSKIVSTLSRTLLGRRRAEKTIASLIELGVIREVDGILEVLEFNIGDIVRYRGTDSPDYEVSFVTSPGMWPYGEYTYALWNTDGTEEINRGPVGHKELFLHRKKNK